MTAGGSIERTALPRRIRSSHRRRLLIHLSEGEGAVSELARRTGLRTPHASAELSRMRQDGLVISDAEAGRRGALQHLSDDGWARLEEDERARLASVTTSAPPDDAIGILLARDGSEVLLGLLSDVDGAYVELPAATEDSRLNRWSLAELREARPRFYDPITLQRVPARVGDDPEKLEAWQDRRHPIGLVRTRLVESAISSTPPVGAWFGLPAVDSIIESPPYDRDSMGWVLGMTTAAAAEVRPAGRVVAILEDRLTANIVAESAAVGALLLIDSESDDRDDSLPTEALQPWIELIHPRLRPVLRRRRLLSVQAHALGTDGGADSDLPDATLRKFRQDWGGRRFVERAEHDTVNLKGLADSARDAIIRWSLELEPPRRLVIQVTTRTPAALIRRLCRSDRLRLLIAPREPDAGAEIARLESDRIHAKPWMRFRTEDGLSFPVRLGAGGDPSRVAPPADWNPPRRVNDIDDWALEVRRNSAIERMPPPKTAVDEREWVWRALHHWPDGDEDFANAAEPDQPLAAWIASTERERWPRWRRIRGNLNRRWLRLMPADSLPIEAIPSLAIDAPAAWAAGAALRLAGLLRQDAEHGLTLRRSATVRDIDSDARGWIASVLLAESSWLPFAQQQELARWGFDAWLEAPPARSAMAIKGVDWLMNHHQNARQEAPGAWRYRMREVALQRPRTDDLHLWANLCDWSSTERAPDRRSLIAIARHLPAEWWAPRAEGLLTALSDDDDGLSWLLKNPVSWAGLILRPPGEVHRIPCGPEVSHRGCRRTLADRLHRLLSASEDGEVNPGLEGLLDLLDSLDAARRSTTPSPGRTHHLIGWLAQPVDLWPRFEPADAMAGDPIASTRLLSRLTGHHADLGSIETIH